MVAIKELLSDSAKRYLEGAQEKGASAWLSCLPLKAMGYTLNKREFQDAICLRYGWKIPGMPAHCACGSVNSVEHSLSCKEGGYVTMRHNKIRDTEASIMQEVAYNVQVEPPLLPVGNIQLSNGTAKEPNAKLDISARGIYSSHERVFFDVRITHPYAPTNIHKTTEVLFAENEKEKIRKYNDRVLQVEKATMVPLVFSTNGGMSIQCQKLHCQLAALICKKNGKLYSEEMGHMRTRLRFALLKSILVAVRGYRGHFRELGTTLIIIRIRIWKN